MDLVAILEKEQERAQAKTRAIILSAAAVASFSIFPALALTGLGRLYILVSALLAAATLIALAAYERSQARTALDELTAVSKSGRCWSWHISARRWDGYRAQENRRLLAEGLWWPIKGLVAAQLAFTAAILTGGDPSPTALLRLAAAGFAIGAVIAVLASLRLLGSQPGGIDAFLTEDGLCIGHRYRSFTSGGCQLETASIAYSPAGPRLMLELASGAGVLAQRTLLTVPVPDAIIGEGLAALEHLAWEWGMDAIDA